MRPPWKAITVGSAAFVALAAAALAAERRLIGAIDAAPARDGWQTPRFPDGSETMVPTDDGAELLVAAAGPPDGPTVVLVHGLTSNHHDWGPVARRLVDDGFRVVGVNQRGHGGSTVGTDGFGAARQGTDLAQVLEAMDLRTVTVVGHSMGGVAALALVTDHPDVTDARVAGLVLVATLAFSGQLDRRLALRVAAASDRAIRDHAVHTAAAARGVFGRTPPRAMIDDAIASARRCPDATRVGASRGLLGWDVRRRLADISTPTLVICGTRDLLTKHAENSAIAAAIPGARFESIADAGHLVIWEEADRVAQLIADHARHRAPSRS